MLIGYASDERYVALADVLFEFEDRLGSFEVRSRASGAVHADIEPGPYRVTISKPGYGAKRVELTVAHGRPYQFRLLADGLLGYAWPKWVRAGQRGEFRVHSVEPYKIDFWRYGWKKELTAKIGWFDEHGPLATMQVTPDGDYTQTRRRVEQARLRQLAARTIRDGTGPVGLVLLPRHAPRAGGSSAFPGSWRRSGRGRRSRCCWRTLPGTRTTISAAAATTSTPTICRSVPTVNARLELARYNDPAFGTWNAEDYAPLSFDRPEPINHVGEAVQITDPIEGRAACHVAPTEWRLLGWLEREGFDYDVYAETQLHAGELDLAAYRVLVLGPHPEYWSRAMYQAVKQWVFERGGRLFIWAATG